MELVVVTEQTAYHTQCLASGSHDDNCYQLGSLTFIHLSSLLRMWHGSAVWKQATDKKSIQNVHQTGSVVIWEKDPNTERAIVRLIAHRTQPFLGGCDCSGRVVARF